MSDLVEDTTHDKIIKTSLDNSNEKIAGGELHANTSSSSGSDGRDSTQPESGILRSNGEEKHKLPSLPNSEAKTIGIN